MPKGSKKSEAAQAPPRGDGSWAAITGSAKTAANAIEIPHPLSSVMEDVNRQIQEETNAMFSEDAVLQANAELGIDIPDRPILERRVSGSATPPPRSPKAPARKKKEKEQAPPPPPPVINAGRARLIKKVRRYWERHGEELQALGMPIPNISQLESAELANCVAEYREVLSDFDEMEAVQQGLVALSTGVAVLVQKAAEARPNDGALHVLHCRTSAGPDILRMAYEKSDEYRRAVSLASIDLAGLIDVGPWGNLAMIIAKFYSGLTKAAVAAPTADPEAERAFNEKYGGAI